MTTGMLIINRVFSLMLGILMITQFFDPRGKSKRTKQLMYSTVFIEVFIVIMSYFYGSRKLLNTLELIGLMCLFFSFYPLFFCEKKKWVTTFFLSVDITMTVTFTAEMIVHTFFGGHESRELLYSIIRITMFVIIGVVIKVTGRDLFDKVSGSKAVKVFENIVIALSVIFIPGYCIFLFTILEQNKETALNLIFSIFMIIGLILISYILYFAIRETLIRQEQDEHEHNENLLRIATGGLVQKIEAIDEYVEKIRVVNHDRRHFNAMLLELLNQGDVEKAKELLIEENSHSSKNMIKWCENSTVNVAIGHYLDMAQEKGISLISHIDIPKEIEYDVIGFSMMLGNLIENAIQACEQIENGEKVIWIKVMYQGQFIIEIENSFEKEVEFDGNGFPVAKRSGHGFGTKSVVAFVQENKGEISYSVKERRFSVRIILP